MNKKVLYTQEQLEIELLKQKNEDIFRLLARMESHISSNFHWTMGLICGLYTICITSIVSAVGHSFGWF